MEPQHSKISVTAKFVAYWRQFADIPYAKEVAEFIEADESFHTLLKQTETVETDFQFFAPFIEARYRSLENMIRRSGVVQVLELASGFSLRGLAMTQSDAKYRYAESDLPELTEEKISLAAQLRAKGLAKANDRHSFVAANALDLTALEAAVESFDRDLPLAIVNEGLLQYLTIPEKAVVAKNVHRLLKDFAPGGRWFTPDISAKPAVLPNTANVSEWSERQKKMHLVIVEITGRNLQAAAFDSYEAGEAFFADHGFKVTLKNQLDEAGTLSSAQKLNVDAKALETMRPSLNIWDMALK